MLFVGANEDHQHLIYVSDTGIAVCAPAKNHAHPLTIQPSEDPNQPPLVIVQPAKGHVHDAVPLPPMPAMPEELKKEEDDAELINRKSTQFYNAHTADRDSIDRGQESVKYREGDQWPEEVKAKLEAKSRACLTINHIAPLVETLSGLYRRNRTDLRCYPTENGDADIADVLTYVLKNIMSTCVADVEEVDAFEDAVTTGRGILMVYPDFDADIRGFLRLRRHPWDMVVFGPHLRKDLEDCEYFFLWNWLSKEQMKNLYPDKAEEIAEMFGRLEQFSNLVYDLSDQDSPLMNSLFADPKNKEIRMLESEEKVYYRLKVYTDPQTGFIVEETEIPKELRGQLAKIKPLRRIERRLYRIRRTVIAGDVVLEDMYVDRPTPPGALGPSFSVFPIYAYKRGNRFEGKVERLKDPQLEINKRRSQIVDIVNTSINNGWLLPKSAFGSQNEKQKFIDTVATPGFTVEVPDMSEANRPVKIEGGRVEPSVVQLELNSLQSFRETSNVNVELLGMGSQYQSGTAISHRIQQSLMGNEYLFDNMSQVKKRIGRELLLWIQELYSPDRIFRLFFDQAQIEQAMVGGEQADPHNMQLMQQIATRLQDADLTLYDITVGETGQSPTAQLANFDMMMELAGKGVPLPPQLFIELAPIPNKARIMQILQQANEAQSQAEDKKYDTEIQKTVIAANAKRMA
jgi:hypothetical protein